MPQVGKVHLLTCVNGYEERHLIGDADHITTFEDLMELLSKIWGSDMSECVLEYAEAALGSPAKAVIIGTDEEWAFARQQFYDEACLLTGYASRIGYCFKCRKAGSLGRSTCPHCYCNKIETAASIVAACKPIEPILVTIRVRTTGLSFKVLAKEQRAPSTNEGEFCVTHQRLEAKVAESKAQGAEFDELKAAHKAQSEVFTALAAAYLRETGKVFTHKAISQYNASTKQQGNARIAPSESSTSVSDVDDDESLE